MYLTVTRIMALLNNATGLYFRPGKFESAGPFPLPVSVY